MTTYREIVGLTDDELVKAVHEKRIFFNTIGSTIPPYLLGPIPDYLNDLNFCFDLLHKEEKEYIIWWDPSEKCFSCHINTADYYGNTFKIGANGDPNIKLNKAILYAYLLDSEHKTTWRKKGLTPKKQVLPELPDWI